MNGRSASAVPCPFRSCLLRQARPPRLCPSIDAVRHRVREVASLRCPPRRRDPARSRAESTANAALMGRHVHRGQAASSLTPGGHCTLCRARVESMSPSRSTGLSAAAFRVPEGIGAARAPRLITARRGPVRARRWAVWRMSRCGIPSSVRSRMGSVAACQHRRGSVSVRKEGARLEEVYPEWKLCHVPVVIGAIAGADSVFVCVPRLPVSRTRREVHSRSSWGF
jgi:hypothetical protein